MLDTAGEDRTAARDGVCSSWIWLEHGGAHRASIPDLGRIVLDVSTRRTLTWCEELYEERTQYILRSGYAAVAVLVRLDQTPFGGV